MPYIITTSQPVTKPIIGGTYLCPMTRRAVGTLDELRDMIASHYPNPEDPLLRGSVLPSGGTIGPLPDGTVVEVEAVGWTTLATGWTVALTDEAAMIDAYNAAQED